MPIIKKGSSENFMIMQREPLQSSDLTMKAKGLLAYLMTLPQDWVIHRTELVTHFKDGKDGVFSALNELIEAGYIVREQQRGAHGKFSEVNYIASDSLLNSPQPEKPSTGKPVTEKPSTENPQLQRNIIQSNNNTKKDNTNNSERRSDEFVDNSSNRGLNKSNLSVIINNSISDNGLDFIYGTNQRQQLIEYVTHDGLGVEVVTNAIQLTKEANKPAFKYTDAILKKRLTQGLTTIEAVQAHEQVRANANGTSKANANEPDYKSHEWFSQQTPESVLSYFDKN